MVLYISRCYTNINIIHFQNFSIIPKKPLYPPNKNAHAAPSASLFSPCSTLCLMDLPDSRYLIKRELYNICPLCFDSFHFVMFKFHLSCNLYQNLISPLWLNNIYQSAYYILLIHSSIDRYLVCFSTFLFI